MASEISLHSQVAFGCLGIPYNLKEKPLKEVYPRIPHPLGEVSSSHLTAGK